MATVSPQLEAVYQRIQVLQQQANELPDSHSTLLSEAFEELQVVLEELQASEEELRHQNEQLLDTRHTLEAERQRYQDLFNWAPNGYLVTNPTGVIQEVNDALAKMLNVSQKFLVGKPLLVFIAQEGRQNFHLELTRLQQLERIQDWEVCLNPRQKIPLDVVLSVSTVRNREGKVVNLRWLVYDITERKRMELLLEQLNRELEYQVQEQTAQLQQALSFEVGLQKITDKVRDSLDESQILQTAVQELALVLGLVSCATAVYDLNLATSTIRYEYTSSEFRGVAASFSSPGQVVSMTTLPDHYHQLMEGEYFQFCDIEISSSRYQFAILSCPIFDDQGALGDLWLFKQQEDAFNEAEIRLVKQVANHCAIAIRQARLYEESQAQVQEMKKLSQLKDNFLSTTSHELRSPVTNMKMAIRMLKIAIDRERISYQTGLLETVGSSVDRYCQILDAECDREINLINDLLDLQRLEAGEQPLVLETIQLQDWIPEVVAPFQGRAHERQQTLQIVLSANLPILVSNSESLERILAELVTNACKYTPPGGQILVSAEVQSGRMQLRVRNSSLEIAASELAHMFDKFYRIPSSDPWKQGGTGLGLALVQKLTEHLGGLIGVEYASGQTCFTIELPLTAEGTQNS